MSTLIEKLVQENNLTVQYTAEGQEKDGYLQGIKRCIDIVKQHSDWISVDDRLPEPNKLVLVAIHRPQYYVPDFMYVTTADYDDVRKKWSSINLVDDLHNVVYWQPFPQLPKPPKRG